MPFLDRFGGEGLEDGSPDEIMVRLDLLELFCSGSDEMALAEGVQGIDSAGGEGSSFLEHEPFQGVPCNGHELKKTLSFGWEFGHASLQMGGEMVGGQVRKIQAVHVLSQFVDEEGVAF
jgi:hypothetical protein